MVLICFFLEYDNIGTPTDIQKCSNGFEFRFDSQGSLTHLKDPASQVAPTFYLFINLEHQLSLVYRMMGIESYKAIRHHNFLCFI